MWRIKGLMSVLEKLSNFSSKLLELKDEDERWDEIAELACELMKADSVSIILFEDNRAVWKGVYGLAKLTSEMLPEELASSEMTSRLFDRKPVVIEDIRSDPRLRLSEEMKSIPIRSILLVPMVASGRSMGVFAIGYAKRHIPTEEEIKLASLLSNQAAIAAERIRMMRCTRLRTNELEVLYSVSRALSGSLHVEEVLENVLDELVKLDLLRPSTGIKLFLIDERSGELKIAAHRFTSPNHPCLKGGIKIGRCLCGLAAQTGEIQIADCKDAGRHTIRWDGVSPHKDICIPIKSGEEVLGVMNLWMPEGKELPEERIELLEAIAGQIAVVLERAHMHHEIERRAEKLAREMNLQAQYAEVVLNSIADGVYSTDLNRIIKTWSRGAEEITRWRAEEVIGRSCADFLRHTNDEGRVLCDVDCPLIESFATKRNAARDAQVHTRDGGRIPVSITVGPIFGENGEVIGAVEVFRDVSKEKELIESIKQANALKDQFLANMSHELRTPLNSIIGFADLLKEQVFGPLNEKQLQYAQNILESGEHLLSLINDILDLSKVETGMLEVNLEQVNLEEMLRWSLTIQNERAKRHNISMNLEVDEGIGTIMTDPTRLKQILLNLVSNAVKFTSDGGSVTVRAKKLDGEIQISVSDTGIGIPKEQRERIFEPFVQLDSSLSRRYEGTGLGLALTKRLVELLGGRIWVESEPDKGSTFHFTIPLDTGTER
jgi:PAS domain S-box-containing protein